MKKVYNLGPALISCLMPASVFVLYELNFSNSNELDLML